MIPGRKPGFISFRLETLSTFGGELGGSHVTRTSLEKAIWLRYSEGRGRI